MGKQQWTPPATDTPVSKSTWTPPSGDTPVDQSQDGGEKKNPDGTTGPDGQNVLGFGANAIIPSSGSDDITSTLAQNAVNLKQAAEGNTPEAYQTRQATNQPKQPDLHYDYDNEGTDEMGLPHNQGTIQAQQTTAEQNTMPEDNLPGAASYSPDHIVGQIDKAFSFVPKVGGFLSSVADNLSNISPKDPMTGKGYVTEGFNWATDFMDKLGDENPLPDTFVGNTVKSLAGAVPLVAGGELFKGAEAASAGADMASNYLTKLDIFQSALTKAAGPLTQYMATTGALTGAADAYKESRESFLPTVEGGIKGFNEGVKSGVTLDLQMAVGGKLGEGLFNTMVKSGLATEDGVLTEQALKSFIGSPTAFAAGSVANNLATGQPIDWENAGISAVTALPFEAPHVFEAYQNAGNLSDAKQTLDASINKVIAVRDNNAIVNFSNANPQDVFDAMQKPETSQELQVQALQKGVEAQQATTYKEKNTLHGQQIDLQNQADIKRIGETIVDSGIDGFSQAVNNSSLPDEAKSTLLNKANAVNQVFNPIELKKTELGQNVEGLNSKIQEFHANNVTMPVGDDLVQLNDLIAQRVKAQGDLFELSYGDNKKQEAGVEKANEVAQEPVTEPDQPIKYFRGEVGGSITPGKGEPIDGSNIHMVFDQKLYDVLNDPTAPEIGVWSKEAALKELQRRGLPETEPQALKETSQEPVVTDNGRKAYPIPDNAMLKGAHLVDVKDNGDVTIREADGSQSEIPAADKKGLGISDDHVKQFRDDNEIETHDTSNINEASADQLYEKLKDPEPPGSKSFTEKKIKRELKKRKLPVINTDPVENPERQEGESEFDHKVRTSTSAGELATMYDDKIQQLKDNLGVDGAIADYRATMRPDEFHEHNDRANVTQSIARNYFSRKGEENNIPMDTQAQEINNMYFNGKDVVTPNEIAEFFVKYPGGHDSYFTPGGNADLKAINERYKEVTGKNLRKDTARKLAAKYNTPDQIAHSDADVVNSEKSHSLIQSRMDDLIHTEGLLDGHPDYDKIQEELDKYVKDPANEFNIFHTIFDGKVPHEAEIDELKRIIDEKRHNQSIGIGPGEGSDAGGENSDTRAESAGEGEAGIKHSDTEPQRVADEYDRKVAEHDERIKRAEDSLKRAEGNINDANDLFASAGSADDGKKENTLFKESADVSKENTDRILKPLFDKVQQLKADRADLLDEKDKAVEQAARQTMFGDAANKNNAEEKIDPGTQELVKGSMEHLFPNIGTHYYDTVAEFNKAAEGTGMQKAIQNGDHVSAFVDEKRVIHFNPEFMTKDTQIHEQGHILVNWAYHYAPELYKRMMDAGARMGKLHAELRANGYDLKGNTLFEEAFVTALGREGADRLNELIEGPVERSALQRFIHEAWTRLERWIAGKTGFSLSKFKNIQDMTFGEFSKYINDKYLFSDVKVSDISSEELKNKNKDAVVNAQMERLPAREAGEGLASYAKRVSEWMDKVGESPEVGKSESPEEADPNAGYNFSETSIKNRVTEEERRARLLDKVEVTAKRDFGQVFETGKQMVLDGRIDPGVLADNLVEKPRPLSAEESAALLYDRMRLYNDHRLTMDNIQDAIESGNSMAETENRTRLSYIEDKINTNDIAARKAGYEQGLGLAARKMMIGEDYSLANQLQLAKIANAGKELPVEIRLKLEDLSKQLDEAQKKLAAYENDASKREAIKAMQKMQREAEVERRATKKSGRKQSIDEINKRISDRKQAIYDKLTKRNTSSSFLGLEKLVDITPDLVLLAKDYIAKGLKSVDEIVDQLHDDFKDHLEGVTKRDIRDAISGYGKVSKLSDDDIDTQLREIKRQARLISALEDATDGERPLKSGFQREDPSDAVRELQRQVHQVMKENGIEIEKNARSDEDAWKSALDAVKTRLKNQITDLTKQLETGEKTPPKVGVKYDQEADALKAERDRLKAAIEEIEGKQGLTDEQRINIAKGALERSIAEYERRIGENDLHPEKKDSKTPETPELTALRNRLNALKENYKQMVDDATPKRTPEEIALAALKKRLANKEADLTDRLHRGDFEPAAKKEPTVLDDEGKRLQVRVNQVQRKFNEEREKIRLANRSRLEKRLDWFAKYRKFILLSNPTTVAKLAAAGATRMVTTPLEELVGTGLSVLPGINKIAEMAPRQGSGSLTAEARSLAEVLSKRSVNEMMRTMKEGKSELDERVDTDEKTYKESGPLELPGKIHAALKTIPKQNEYYRSLQKRIEFALKNGYDITSPDVQTSLQMQSFKDANPGLFTPLKTIDMADLEKSAFNDSKRAIFMQDNFLSDEFTAMLKRWENRGPKGEVAATIARVFLPIIKIPTNFVAETSSYAIGGAKALIAISKGIENLKPDDADYILRAMKKQGVGIGFFALGYMLPNAVGGFFTDGEKKRKGNLQQNDLLLFGHAVPHWLMHAPVLEVMQMGATIRHIHDQYAHNSKVSGFTEAEKGTLAISKGLLGQIPLFGEPADIAKAGENVETAEKFAANFIMGLVEPYDIQRAAKAMDTDSRGNEVHRKAKGFVQEVESGIPIVREHLKKK